MLYKIQTIVSILKRNAKKMDWIDVVGYVCVVIILIGIANIVFELNVF